MRRFITIILVSITVFANGQTIFGKWKSIDDNTGKEKSVVEITERDGKVYGRIITVFRQSGQNPDPICDKCPTEDARYKKKIVGMEIIKDLVKDGNEYSGGSVLDPEAGKIYSCKIWLEENKLKVRGYWGLFYRTQTWERSQ